MTSTTSSHPGDGLTIEQLLHVLRERVVSALLNRPPDLTLDKAQAYTKCISDLLIRAMCLENVFRSTIRAPPDILCAISSYLNEEDLFYASQVCHYWRSALTSSPSLWTRITCQRVPRTLAGLERCKSLPIQLRLERSFSTAALESVLSHGSRISSLITNQQPSDIPLLRQLLTSSLQSLEQLHICAARREWLGVRGSQGRNIQEHLPSLRELLVYQYSFSVQKLDAPNLVHLALEDVVHERVLRTRAVLDMLRGFPLSETFLLGHLGTISRDTPLGYSPVCLPHLRSIELGEDEVCSGLMTFLRFPRNIAVGFRMILQEHLYRHTPPRFTAAIQQVLGTIEIRSITLAVPLSYFDTGLLIHFEGLGGTLEITTDERPSNTRRRNLFLALDRTLLCGRTLPMRVPRPVLIRVPSHSILIDHRV